MSSGSFVPTLPCSSRLLFRSAAMAPVWSRPSGGQFATVASKASVIFWIYVTYKWLPGIRKRIREKKVILVGKDEKKRADEKKFFTSLKRLLAVLIPGIFCKETFWMSSIAVLLVARSMCDLWMISNGTLIERVIIGKEPDLFKKHVLEYIVAMPIVAVINGLLRLNINRLKLVFRIRLSRRLHELYMENNTFYKMTSIDSRVQNPDQILTQDVDKFCNGLVDLYSNMSKPILDIVIYIVKLTSNLGGSAPLFLSLYMMFAGFVLTRLRRPMAPLTAKEQQLEGHFRFIHSRVISNSEEIAFYNGSDTEKDNLNRALDDLSKHIKDNMDFKFIMGFGDSIIAKYFATVVGYFAVSRPFLSDGDSLVGRTPPERLENYYKSGRMMVKLAQSVGRLILAGREMSKLAGFTSRLSEFMDVLRDVKTGHYVRTKVKTDEEVVPIVSRLNPGASSGRVVTTNDGLIRFENVCLATPTGDVLVESLNLEIRAGTNVLICGPNGCGKSSLFRVLGGLWPVARGTLTKPSGEDLFYIPQRPYMTLGTLRDQVIYPDSWVRMQSKGVIDEKLKKYLSIVKLDYILEREGGWDATADWMDVLSGGEKQRIAMARLLYHNPVFAILDECTSAVSCDVEDSIYSYCRLQGITLFTVSHRKSLWKHHDYYLHMDGRGNVTFKTIDPDTQPFGS